MPLPRPTRIALCVPVYDHPKMQFWRSIRALQFPQGALVTTFDSVGLALYSARNLLARRALDWGADQIVWIDSDMVFEPDALLRLLARGLPVVGGLYFNRNQPHQPIAYTLRPDGTYDVHPDLACCVDPSTGLIRVGGTGGGFLVVAREVFCEIDHRGLAARSGWFLPTEVEEEDLAFCSRVRAAGYSIFVDARVELGHVGEVVVDRAYAERWAARAAERVDA